MKNKILKIVFIILGILLIIPSIIYLIQNKTIIEFNTYYNFFLNDDINKNISTSIYLVLFITMMFIYVKILKQRDIFKNIRQIMKYVFLISIIFVIMIPWTSSDIFYYMGVGELDSQYGQNPYYITMKEYYNQENLNDTILEKGANSYWGNTTVVYGPIAQLIFKIFSAISFKNIDICLFVFKLLNLIIHLANCYLIYKLTNKKFTIIYGLNPFVLLEFIGNVHNDIIVVFFVLLAIYFLKNKKLILSIASLALATGIKYFTILLLPFVILYHFRNEKKIGKRIVNCIKYSLLFFGIFILEYALYLRDFQIFTAVLVQTEKYAKSLHSVLLQIDLELMLIIKFSLQIIFFMYYCKICIDLLVEKNIKFYKIIKNYNISLILFLLILTNFHQWYLIWLFATIMWQKSNMIRNIIGLTAITEIANSIYMFKAEAFIYDRHFFGISLVLFLIWVIVINKKRLKITGGNNG